jgi:hypothetical protein
VKNLGSVTVVSILLLLMGGAGWDAQANEAGSGTVTKRGGFALVPFGGAQSFRVTNSSGGRVGYSGQIFGLGLALEPMSELMPGFNIFLSGGLGEGSNSDLDSETYSLSQYQAGFVYFASRFLFVQGGYRVQDFDVKNPRGEIIGAKMTGFSLGAGIEVFQIGQGWGLTLGAQGFSGYSPRDSRHDFNMGYDGVEYLLGIRWSPTVSFSAGR